MRIAFVLPVLAMSGGVKVVLQYANYLQKRGHRVYIVVPMVPPFWKRYLTKNGIITSATRYFSGSSVIKDYFSNVKIIKIPYLLESFNKFVPKSDVIIATSWETAYFVNHLQKEKGEKFYFVQHYEIWDIWESINCWRKAKTIEKDTTKLPIAMSYIVPDDLYLKNQKEKVDATYVMPLKKITISSWLKELLEKRFNQKVYGIVLNGIDPYEFKCNKLDKWDRIEDKKVILMPLRGSIWKGDNEGLQAIATVKKEYPDVEVHTFGGAIANIPAYVTHHGIINRDKLRDLYCSAHIFVYPSWVEGFGLPPMEAMACMTAVASTNVGALPDYAIQNETALLVPPQNPEKLAEAILKLLDNPEKTKKMAMRAYSYIQQFTVENAVRKFEGILYKAMGV